MNVLVTGANGFIGKNLILKLRDSARFEVLSYVRDQTGAELRNSLRFSDAVVHLAGVNRSSKMEDFHDVNTRLTEELCNYIIELGMKIPVLLASSTQATLDNHYGHSKYSAEQVVKALAKKHGNPVAIYRLPGVFGKWCKPNYNSVVATFCHNKAHNLPVKINDHNTIVNLVYIDDVVNSMIELLNKGWTGLLRAKVKPEYSITLGELSNQIDAFKSCRHDLMIERVGVGLTRALYATYLSYIPKSEFAYRLPVHSDKRGMFVEMLKTPDAGQFSFFTAPPGVRRGGHYHNTKTEKFLVIKGHARFGFRHMLTNEILFLETNGREPQIVETIPGWTHDITNIGDDDLVVMLWASEVFQRESPDTFASRVIEN